MAGKNILKGFILAGLLLSVGCVSAPVQPEEPEVVEEKPVETPIVSKPSIIKRTIKDLDLKVSADNKGMKKRVVVLPLLDRDGLRSEELLARVYTSFVDDLNKNSDVIALSHTELKLDFATLIDNNEYKMSEIAQKSLTVGASALLEAKIVDLRFKNLNMLENNNTERKASFEIVVKARLVNIRSGQEMMNMVKTVQLEEENTKIPSQITSDIFFEKNPELVELLIRDGLTDFVPKLSEAMTQISWEGRIAALQGEKVLLNVGRISGVQVGDILKVVDDGTEVYDPEMGYHIGKVQGKVKGTLEVVGFFGQDGAISVIHSGAGFKENDRIEIYE